MTYTVADYIVDRLLALKVGHLFQVPGNYSSDLLRTAQARGIQCVNTTNELEAGYAADACARLHGIGVLCVTLGVGALSALNAVTGSFVEYCPVLLLNGSANKKKVDQMVAQGVLFAHAIDLQRSDETFFQHATAATAVLSSADNAPAEIDRVLRAMLTASRPVYLEVHDLVWAAPCDPPAEPDVPLEPFPPTPGEAADQRTATTAAARAVADLIVTAKKPVLWGGEELQRWRLEPLFAKLVELTGLPYTTTLMGKGLLSEDTPGFIGVYDSKFAPPEVRAVVEDTDRLVALGTILGDFYGPVVERTFDRMVLASGQAVRTGASLYPNVPLPLFLPALIEALAERGLDGSPVHAKPAGYEALVGQRAAHAATARGFSQGAGEVVAADAGEAVGWDNLFERLHGFVDTHPELLVMADTSMALFPSAGLPIHRPRHFVAQMVWLSIGYTIGAAVGASHLLSGNERVFAIAGDGGFQMIPQALSTLVSTRKPAIIIVCDNGLYGIEQFLIDAGYFTDPGKAPIFFNKLAFWDYEALAKAFGAWGRTVATLGELDTALQDVLSVADRPALIAVKLPAKDLPSVLRPTPPPPSDAGVAALADSVGRPKELLVSSINAAAFD